jgi:protein-disulfide isomerase
VRFSWANALSGRLSAIGIDYENLKALFRLKKNPILCGRRIEFSLGCLPVGLGCNYKESGSIMANARKKYLLISVGMVVLGGVIFAGQGPKQASTPAATEKSAGAVATSGKTSTRHASASRTPAGSGLSDAALRERVIGYVRERFGMPATVTITADPFKPSIHPSFDETTIYTDNGKNKSPNSAFVTKDQKWLVLGKLVPVQSDPKNELITHLREQFKLPPTTNVTVTDFRISPYPNLLATTVSVTEGNKPPEIQELFMTSDGRVLVVGGIFSLAQDPRKTALKGISTVNQPRSGPATAPVTIVEFSDLQCPMCARMHDFIENDVLKKYSGKVQVIFKEFPLANIHDWTLTASIANQCVYQINPNAYLPFRSLIYKNQLGTNAGNVRDLMLSYGEQLGLDRLRLAGCIDSKASLPRVEANFLEGKNVGVSSTPTSFINGKMVVGMPNIDEFHKDLDEALKARR